MIRFTVSLDKDGYRARRGSGSDLIWWTEGYERKAGALNAIRIAKASYNAPVYDRTAKAYGGAPRPGCGGVQDLAQTHGCFSHSRRERQTTQMSTHQ